MQPVKIGERLVGPGYPAYSWQRLGSTIMVISTWLKTDRCCAGSRLRCGQIPETHGRGSLYARRVGSPS